MAGSRRASVLVGVMLLGCIAAVVFVFDALSSPGRPFGGAAAAKEPARAPLPPPASAPAAPASEPEPAPPPPAAEPPPPPPAAPGGEAEAPEEDPARAEEYAELVLELLAPEAGEDRGILVRVVDETGVAIPAALVAFRQGTALLYRERTDASGEALFVPFDAEAGPFRVDAVASGFLAATAPEVAPGATIALVLRARPWVEGRVSAPSLRGVVKLFAGERVLTEPIGEDGSFRFPPVDEGYMTVQVDMEPFGSDSETFFLEAGTRRSVHLRVQDRGRGHLFGDISFWPGKGKAWVNGQEVFVTPSGTFEFEKAILGLNEIEIDAPGKALFRERFQVNALQKTKVRFRLHNDATIRGRVRSERNGREVAGAEVRLGVEFGDPRNDRVPLYPVDRVPVVKTDGDGRFLIERLDPRLTYLVSIISPGHGQFVGPAVPSPGTLRIELPQGPFVFGKLHGVGGVPRDAVVSARRIEDQPSSRVFNVSEYDAATSGRDQDGFFGLAGLVNGIYVVRVDAPGYGAVETLLDLQEGQRERVDFRLHRGADVAQEDVELLRRLPPVLDDESRAPADVTMLHVDARRPVHEPPLPGIRVRFFDGDLEMAAPMSFTESEFDLTGLPEATYRAVLTHPSLPKPVVVDPIRLRRGEPYTVELR